MASYKVEFSEGKYAIKDNNSDAHVARIKITSHRLFPLNVDDIGSTHVTQGEEASSMLWHRIYGHLNQKSLQLLSLKQLVDGLPLLHLYNHVRHAHLENKLDLCFPKDMLSVPIFPWSLSMVTSWTHAKSFSRRLYLFLFINR